MSFATRLILFFALLAALSPRRSVSKKPNGEAQSTNLLSRPMPAAPLNMTMLLSRSSRALDIRKLYQRVGPGGKMRIGFLASTSCCSRCWLPGAIADPARWACKDQQVRRALPDSKAFGSPIWTMPRSTIIMLSAGEPVTNMVSLAAKSRIRKRVKSASFSRRSRWRNSTHSLNSWKV